jgi:hypothetical protein
MKNYFLNPSMISYIDQKSTSTARNDLRKKVSLFNFENRYVTKMLSYGLWTSLPIDSDKVVYAIAKTLPIRKNLKRNEIYI